jgi:hypothetical protein
MNGHIDDDGLRLVLDGVTVTGDADLEHAVTRAEADLERIQHGLRLLADEVAASSSVPEPKLSGRPKWQLLAFAATAVIVAAVLGVGIFGRGAAPTGSSVATPRFLPDRFDYRVGAVGSGASVPGLPYTVPVLWDISAASQQAAWIVGSISPRALAWEWNGTRWRNVRMPRLSGDAELHAVATLGPGDAWAVGSHSGSSDQFRVSRALVEHWDGTAWTVITVPVPEPATLWSVSASSVTDVWAAGVTYQRDSRGKFPADGSRPLLLHWNGVSWQRVALPWSQGGLELDKVVATSPSNVWVIQTGGQDVRSILIEHWNGKQWRLIPAPFGPRDPIRGFTTTSLTDAWAVGGYRRSGHSRTLAAHWNGRAWQIAPTPNRNTDSVLTDVAAVAPDDVWALGQSQYLKITKSPADCRAPSCGTEIQQTWPVALFEHWNGERWELVPGAAPQMWEGPTGLAVTKDGTAWAAGGCYWDDVITRWNGTAWQIARHPPDRYWRLNTRHQERTHLVSCSRP